MATVKFNIADDDIRSYASRALGGEWSAVKDDGRLYSTRECEYDEVRLSVDLREFLSAYLGYPADGIVLAWDPHTWTYSAHSRN